MRVFAVTVLVAQIQGVEVNMFVNLAGSQAGLEVIGVEAMLPQADF